jgi:hypothetical protein
MCTFDGFFAKNKWKICLPVFGSTAPVFVVVPNKGKLPPKSGIYPYEMDHQKPPGKMVEFLQDQRHCEDWKELITSIKF